MLKVGITGGIGSGKTTVCKVFNAIGISIFYADIEAKEILDTSITVRKKLIEKFGEEIYSNNSVNRPKLAIKIFSDNKALEFVNSIIHPEVRNSFYKFCEKHKNEKYVIEEAAVLFESGANKDLDYVISVFADENTRISRVLERDNTDVELIKNRMSFQFDDSIRQKMADEIIVNDNDVMLLPQIIKIHKKLIDKKLV
ncbi:MAG: dephospho-CoA kinase [Bacteroidales bacterium]|jgi:dephospho-CoA kinase|nr:dephospho-CoA kinase [Bacteroidales bacterium]